MDERCRTWLAGGSALSHGPGGYIIRLGPTFFRLSSLKLSHPKPTPKMANNTANALVLIPAPAFSDGSSVYWPRDASMVRVDDNLYRAKLGTNWMHRQVLGQPSKHPLTRSTRSSIERRAFTDQSTGQTLTMHSRVCRTIMLCGASRARGKTEMCVALALDAVWI